MLYCCCLGWLIDPANERVHIYRANGERSVIEGFDNVLSGDDVLVGFELRLGELR